MSVTFKQGNILDATENIIVNQVNCFGKMGAGLAKQIAEKWPKNRDIYEQTCEEKEGNEIELLGSICWYPIEHIISEKPQWIANVFGQYSYGRSKNVVYTNYNALREAFQELDELGHFCLYSVAIPYGLGCGLGNGDWDGVVLPMIKNIFKFTDVVIYKLEESK